MSQHDLSTMTRSESIQPPAVPRGIALSGILFSGLYLVSLTHLRLAVPANPADAGDWLADVLSRNRVLLALNLIPFTGIAFLWFMAVLRNRIGLREDRFFSTIFLGSGYLFVAMLFVATGFARGLIDTFGDRASLPGEEATFRAGRDTVHALMNTFGMRMAAVFMFVTSTIGLRTAVFSKWVACTGFVLGLVLLLAISDFAWVALLFPGWALLVSLWILVADLRQIEHRR